MTRDTRNFGLDLARALAITAVMFAHFSWLWWEDSSSIKRAAYLAGVYGVELFFVLSGFLIGGILIRALNEQGATMNTVRVFWLRRWFRTLPNYYLFLLLFALTTPLFGGTLAELWRYPFFLQNLWTNHVDSFYGQTWSLTVEEWMYIILALLLVSIHRLLDTRKSALIAACTVIVGCLAARLLFADGTNWTISVWKVAIFRLDAIAFGVLLAYLKSDSAVIWKRLQSPYVAALGSLICVALTIAFQVWIDPYSNTNPTVAVLAFFPALDIGFALVLPFLTTIVIQRGAVSWAVTHISIYSYSLYLCNQMMMGWVDLIAREVHRHQVGLRVVGYVVGSFVVAAFVYHFFELPVMRLRERFGKQPSIEAAFSEPSLVAVKGVQASDIVP